MADLYQLLAVSYDASAEQLRSAYRRQLRRHHPDRFRAGSVEHQQACAVTRAVVAAWEVLGEPASRAAYDATLGRVRESVREPVREPVTVPPAALGRADDPAAAERRRRVQQRYADVLTTAGRDASPSAGSGEQPTGPQATLRLVLTVLAWGAGAVWAVHVSHLLGSPRPTPGAWVVALVLGAVLVGPWWLLARSVPAPATTTG